MSRLDFLGITVLGDFILSEGADSILENMARIGATAVAVNPTVTAPGDESNGSWQPPIDAGSSPRVFDRPLWGKHALWVRSGVSYRPNEELYRGCDYSPRKPNDLTEEHGHVIGDFIDRAVDAGLKVYFQVGAVQPSGLRDKDRPRLPDGTIPQNRMADTASLASEAVRSYNRAYVQDLLEAYPRVTGFRPDWPEYPCYTLGEVFQDFSEHVAVWATDGDHDYDFDAARCAAAQLWDLLNGNRDDRQLTDQDFTREWSRSDLSPGLAEWLKIKRGLSIDILLAWRDAIVATGRRDVELSANAFMTPYSNVTGLSFDGAGAVCAAVSPKFYTMHWSLMVKFWAEPILAENPQLSEEAVVGCLVRLMDIAEGDTSKLRVADYGYPDPHEPHPVPDEPQLRKLEQVASEVGDYAKLTPLVHGYGPPEDFRRRLELVAGCQAIDGLWINRYGYLGEEKLDAIRDVC